MKASDRMAIKNAKTHQTNSITTVIVLIWFRHCLTQPRHMHIKRPLLDTCRILRQIICFMFYNYFS